MTSHERWTPIGRALPRLSRLRASRAVRWVAMGTTWMERKCRRTDAKEGNFPTRHPCVTLRSGPPLGRPHLMSRCLPPSSHPQPKGTPDSQSRHWGGKQAWPRVCHDPRANSPNLEKWMCFLIVLLGSVWSHSSARNSGWKTYSFPSWESSSEIQLK